MYTVDFNFFKIFFQIKNLMDLYRNDPKFSDRQFWANSAVPNQTAPRGAV